MQVFTTFLVELLLILFIYLFYFLGGHGCDNSMFLNVFFLNCVYFIITVICARFIKLDIHVEIFPEIRFYNLK